MRLISVWTILAALSSMAVGCAGSERHGLLAFTNRLKNDPIVLDVAGPLSIDVQSFNGDVVVDGDPSLKQATITVVRESVHGMMRGEEGRSAMGDINVAARIAPAEMGQVLRVRTSTVNLEPHYLRAHVHISAPVDGVRVRTTNGIVDVNNVRGPLEISTTEGDVRVITNQALTQKVTIVSRNGDIDYRVRGESSGTFDAQTVNGRVHHVVRYGTVRIEGTTRDDTLHCTINAGTNPVVMRTVNGDIRIAFVHNPDQIGHTVVD